MVFLRKRLLDILMQIFIMLRHLVAEISRFKFDDYRVIRTGASDLKLFGAVYIWQSDTMTKCTSGANVNIPHINDKTLTVSIFDDRYYMYLKIALNDNNLPCFKPIPIPRNSFTGNICDIDIHSARDRELGQQSFEIKTTNACCKYSGLQHRLQHGFSKCTATTASE